MWKWKEIQKMLHLSHSAPCQLIVKKKMVSKIQSIPKIPIFAFKY